jgi:hypothetical protein
MATYLELQWLGLTATPTTTSNSDPATGAKQDAQTNWLEMMFATSLADSDGSVSGYPDVTILSQMYRAKATGTGYSVGDLLQRDRTFDFGASDLAVSWFNVTADTELAAAPPSADVLAETAEIVTQHVDKRELTLPNQDPSVQTRTYTVDIWAPFAPPTDTGWQ